MSKVKFNKKNEKRCICEQCPVQTKSVCIQEKIRKMSEGSSNEMDMPPVEDVPELYCASGKASCQDIDTQKMCICGQCAVWQENNLVQGEPESYYCRDGKAE